MVTLHIDRNPIMRSRNVSPRKVARILKEVRKQIDIYTVALGNDIDLRTIPEYISQIDLDYIGRVSWSNIANLIYCSDLFIGVDSCMGVISNAVGRNSFLFFGTINPKCRYFTTNVTPVVGECPRLGCHHEQAGRQASNCPIHPSHLEFFPCMETINEDKVIEQIITRLRG